MGSPIPSPEEGAWTREGSKYVDGGFSSRLLMSLYWNHESNNPSLQVLTQSTVSVIGVSQQQKPKNKRNLDKRISDSFHTTTRRICKYAGVTYCYVGSSVPLLVLER